MVKEIDINMWTTAENGTENLDFVIRNLTERPLVQVYKYMQPDNNVLAEELESDSVKKGVGVQGEETMIFIKSRERFRGYVIVK